MQINVQIIRGCLSCLNQIESYVHKLIHIGKQHINDIGIFEAKWCYTLVADDMVLTSSRFARIPHPA